MRDQNYKNHRQFVPTYHLLTGLGVVALLIGTIRYMIVSSADNFYIATLLVLVAFILLSLYLHVRFFVNKVQDRAIRAEEKLRYFIITGKAMDERLTTNQIIALRFASDAELPSLAEKAVSESLSNDDIKRKIKIWKGDYYRV